MRHESGGTMEAGQRVAGELVVGVDEAGRGPLAGPVVVGAVILDPAQPVAGVADSKRLTARRREALADTIRKQALAWVVVRAEPAEIDELNILQATMRAMQHAVAALPVPAQRALIDGNRCPPLDCPAKAVVGGDGSEPAIGAASILAKVARDRDMVALDDQWPGYGFARHKGYPTRDHVAALRRLGACPAHRRSFAPVREALTAPELPLEDT